MIWDSLGFKANPFNTDPIRQATLHLYTGRDRAITTCSNTLAENNVLLVIEGARGIGTTSFGNYLRFNAQQMKNYFTPTHEIRVGPGWTLETLLSVVIANIVREIELYQSDLGKSDPRFENAKALSVRIAETYRSFGISAFGSGISYGKNAGITSQPVTVPAAVLGHHLEDLASIICEAGYRHGILLQLNNLDVDEIHDEKHLKYLFNELRDYIQTDNVSWMLVGDVGLRRFIAQKVDRLDDIISHEVKIGALSEKEFWDLVNLRVNHYKVVDNADLPIEDEVLLYLFKLTKGRLRYVFGLIKRLINDLAVGDLTDKLTLDIVKPMVVQLAKERIERNDITKSEQRILEVLVQMNSATPSQIAKELKQTRQPITRTLTRLYELKLVTSKRDGRSRIFYPVLDVEIAYAKQEGVVE